MQRITQWGFNPAGYPDTIPSGFCNPPTGLQATVTGTSVYLQWVAPHNYAAFRLFYKKVADPTYTSVLVYGTNTSIIFDPTSTYNWKVETICNIGTDRKSTQTTGTNFVTTTAIPVCGTVDALTITVTPYFDYIDLAWPVATLASGYIIYYREIGELNLPFSGLPVVTNAGRLPNLKTGTTYEFFIQTQCGNSFAPESQKLRAITLRKNGSNVIISADPGTNMIKTNWAPLLGAESYNVLVNDVAVQSNYSPTAYNIPGLTPGTQYKVAVIANFEDGSTEPGVVYVTTQTAVIPPPTGLGFVYSAPDLTINWTPATGIDSQVILINGAPVALSAGTSNYVISGVLPLTIYNIEVKSIIGTTNSAPLTGSYTTPFFCKVPVGLALISKTDTSALVQWTLYPGIDTYKLTVTDTVSSIALDYLVSGGSKNVTGLVPNRLYNFKVRSECGTPSSYTADLGITTNTLQTAETPLNITFAGGTQNTVRVSFTLPSGILNGTFQIRFSDGVNPVIVTNTTTTQNVLVSTLLANTAYTVTVVNSPAGFTAATSAGTPYTTPAVCGIATGLGLTVSSDQQTYTITGTGAGGAINYTLKYRLAGDTVYQTRDYGSFPMAIDLIPGQYEFQVVTNCAGGVTSNPVAVVGACLQIKNVLVLIKANQLTISFTKLNGTGSVSIAIASIFGGVKTFNAVANGATYTLDTRTTYSITLTHTCADGSTVNTGPYVVTTGDTDALNNPAFTPLMEAHILDCPGCCTETADGVDTNITLKPYLYVVTGPATITIPLNIKSMAVVNLGNGGGTYANVGLAGITGTGFIPANVKRFELTVEDDPDIIVGDIVVTPVTGHTVVVTYML